jgi:hypothetical protein
MTVSVQRETWSCPPSLAYYYVERSTWIDAELVCSDLDLDRQLVKRADISYRGVLILNVHCFLQGDVTAVEFLVPTGLRAEDMDLARRVVARALEVARQERLQRHPIGFAPPGVKSPAA